MKYLTLFFVAVTTTVFSQDVNKVELPRAIIKISPFQFFSQTLELSIESLTPDYGRAIQVSGSLRSGQNDYLEGKGGGGTLAYRKYVRPLSTPIKRNPDAYQGIYYSVYLKADFFKGREGYWGQVGYQEAEQSVTSINPGFTIGVQRTIFDVIFLDMYIGGGIKFAKISYDTYQRELRDFDIFHPAYGGIHPVAGVKIGVGL